MTVYDRQSGIEALGPPPLWVCALLGIVMIAAGIVALSDVVFATIISVKLIGLTAIAAGAFEICMRSGPRDGAASSGKSFSARSISPSGSCCSPSRLPAR